MTASLVIVYLKTVADSRQRITACTPKNKLDADGNCGPLEDQGGSGSITGLSLVSFIQIDGI